MLADCVVIIGLHFLDRGLKAEAKLRQMDEEKRAELHELDKKQATAMKSKSRDAQKHTVSKPAAKGSSAFGNRMIQQPRKLN
jgi:mannitol-specific phosphotransferase system IIBC component